MKRSEDSTGASPSVTIITRTKKRPLLLERALESVLGQTFRDWQLIVVYEPSDAKQVESLLSSKRDRFAGRVQTLVCPEGVGPVEPLNEAIRASNSLYLAIHDDDDRWHPEFLNRCVNHLEKHAELGGVATHWTEVSEEIVNDAVRRRSQRRKAAHLSHISLSAMSHSCLIVPICFLHRREVLRSVGHYNGSLEMAEDWDFYLRFLQHYEIGVIPEPLAFYHKRAGGEQYVNAITRKADALANAANAIRNGYLRRDLQKGKMGLGFLMNSTHFSRQLSLWELLKNDLRKVVSRFRSGWK